MNMSRFVPAVGFGSHWFDLRSGPQGAVGQQSRRNASANYFDSNGLQTVGANVPRYMLNPTFGAGSLTYAPGLLTEGDFTNDCLSPENVREADANWSAVGSVFSTSNGPAPDGSSNGALAGNLGAGESGVKQTISAWSAINNEKVSVGICTGVHAADTEFDWLCIRLTKKDGTKASCFFNARTGAVGTASGGAINPVSLFVGNHGTGLARDMYYVGFTADIGSGATTPVLEFILADADGDTTTDGPNLNGQSRWGAIAVRLPYLPMYAGSNATDDSFDCIWDAAAPFLDFPSGVTPGAILLDFTPLADGADLYANNGSANTGIFNSNFTALVYNAGGSVDFVGASTHAGALPALSAGVRRRIVLNFDGTNVKAYEGGAEVYSALDAGLTWGAHCSVSQYVLSTGREPGMIWHECGVFRDALPASEAAAISA